MCCPGMCRASENDHSGAIFGFTGFLDTVKIAIGLFAKSRLSFVYLPRSLLTDECLADPLSVTGSPIALAKMTPTTRKWLELVVPHRW
jgi:hypothetical protein